MARLIPRKTKVKIQFFKNFFFDGYFGSILLLNCSCVSFLSGVQIRFYLGGAFAILSISLFMKLGEDRLYQSIGHFFRFIFANKNFSKGEKKITKNVKLITPYTGLVDFKMHDGGSESDDISLIDYNGSYYGAVVEIRPVQFYMLSEQRQNQFINAVDNALKNHC